MPDSINVFSGEYRFLSNFYIEEDGLTNEHHFQAAKTDDPDWIARILSLHVTAGQAKRMGRQCPLRPTWEQEKLLVMRVLLRRKFSHHKLGELLMNTGDAQLVEGNNWGDHYWGVCNGVGWNHLGLALMETRTMLLTIFRRREALSALFAHAEEELRQERQQWER